MSDQHIPVMLPEVLEALKPADHDVIIDGTFGGGGYTTAILEHANCKVIAIDQDPAAYERANILTETYPQRLMPVHGAFSDMKNHIANQNIQEADGIVLDIGVSSFQIDQAERGFSFQKDGPLDMRMNKDQKQTAAHIVNEMEEKELADLIYQYGDERHSRKIARAIVKARQEKQFETTSELAAFIEAVIPKSKKDKQHPATRTFQALRIAVNDELGELEKGLEAAEDILKDGGRIVVVTFHSLEDSIVKNFLKKKSGMQEQGSRYMPEIKNENVAPAFKLIHKKAIAVSEEEAGNNPRARSAKLRWAVRIREAK